MLALSQETTSRKEQYTLQQILAIWLIAAAPMWLLGWVAYPAFSAGLQLSDAGRLRITLLAVGLVWQFLLSLIILYREEGNFRPETISRRFWLNHPISPRTGQTNKALAWAREVMHDNPDPKVIFWNIAFGVANCSSYSNDGKGRCKR